MNTQELARQKTNGYMLLTINEYLLENSIITEEEKRRMESFIKKKHKLQTAQN